MSVINAASCNGTTSTSCGQTPPTVTVGTNPYWIAADQAADTIYTTNYNNGTVSVINGADCNATVGYGCGQAQPTATTGSGAGFDALDPGLHTLLVMNQGDDTISEINTQTCDGAVTSGCRARQRNEQATFHPPQGYNPSVFALDPQTGTAYLVNVGGENYLAAVSISRCNATNSIGCRVEAPSVPDHETQISVDPATDTIYAGNLTQPRIDVINGATCHAGDRSGCAPVATIPFGHTQVQMDVGSLDEATHTLYASDIIGHTVAVINTAACNATRTTGCGTVAATIKVGSFPVAPEVNPVTGTVYVRYGEQANKVAVISTATCDAENTSGCGQAPAVARIEPGGESVAVSARFDTVYATTDADHVELINGATCNGTDHSGCGHPAAIAKVGAIPVGVALDNATHTLYVTNWDFGDMPATVSVINTATCNAVHTTGCAGPFPVTPTGAGPFFVAVNTSTNAVYVSDFDSAAVTIFDGARCDATVTSGCGTAGRLQPVSSQPFGLAVDQRSRTVYVATVFDSGGMSLLRTG